MSDNFDAAKQYDDTHDVFNRLCDAFVASGGCAHDLGLVGALAVVQEWEKIRTEAAVLALRTLGLEE